MNGGRVQKLDALFIKTRAGTMVESGLLTSKFVILNLLNLIIETTLELS